MWTPGHRETPRLRSAALSKGCWASDKSSPREKLDKIHPAPCLNLSNSTVQRKQTFQQKAEILLVVLLTEMFLK